MIKYVYPTYQEEFQETMWSNSMDHMSTRNTKI